MRTLERLTVHWSSQSTPYGHLLGSTSTEGRVLDIALHRLSQVCVKKKGMTTHTKKYENQEKLPGTKLE